MRGRRMGRPGLVGTVARTAVVAGTAGAVSHRQQQRYAEQDMAAQPQQPAAAPVAPSNDDAFAEIEKLGKLKDQGYITEDEFNAKKATLLGL